MAVFKGFKFISCTEIICVEMIPFSTRSQNLSHSIRKQQYLSFFIQRKQS